MLTGKQLIKGEWCNSTSHFSLQSLDGTVRTFASADSDQVSAACMAAEQAFWSFAGSSTTQRAWFLNKIATEIEALGDELITVATQETGLPSTRLQGERARTTGQLRLFAEHITKTDYPERRHDEALPDRQPLPRPELYLMQQPIGPVAVFGASNFPLAFSTAGGDTAAALAAGCPVVVKGHDAHPGTSELVAQAIERAAKACDLHPGIFNLLQGNTYELGQKLVQHPLIKAVGFTGSLRGGRALFDLCCARPEPIPFFGELGSVNPVFLLPHALSERAERIAQDWAVALTMGAGQFCTNPGVTIALKSTATDTFIRVATAELEQVAAQTMLTEGIAQSYQRGNEQLQNHPAIDMLLITTSAKRQARPNIYKTSAKAWLDSPDIAEEVFGPSGIIVVAQSQAEILDVAKQLKGQLTCCLHMNEADTVLAQQLLPVLQRKAGRVLANGFPTGVEVADSMVHGGPYPASTNFGATSVGTLSIRRFLRPVCYQNLPDELLPAELLRRS